MRKQKEYKLTETGKIPKEWELSRLDTLLSLEYGKGLPERERTGGRYPVIGSSGIVGYHNQSKVIGPGIIIGRKGSIGAITLIKSDFWPIDTTYYVKTLVKDIDLKWLFYALIKLNLPKLNLSDVVPGLKRELVHSLKLPLPPLPEQQKIAEILLTVDQAIEKVDEAIKKTQRMKKGLMQELLTKGIGHKEFKDTEIGRIPKEWELEFLSNIAYLERGKFAHRPRNDPKFFRGKYPFIQTGDISEANGIIKNFSQTLNEEGIRISKLFRRGTIVISIAGNIGDVGILGFDSYFPDSIVGISPDKKKINNYFLMYLMNKLKSELNSMAPRSTQKNINLEILKKIKVPFPSLSEQQKIAEILSTVDSRLEMLRKRKGKIERIKKGLMNDLLTGRKRVKLDS